MTALIPNIISFVALIYFINKRYYSSKSLIEPGIFFAFNLLLLYPIRGVVLIFFGDDAMPDYPGISNYDNLLLISWYSTIGCLGYIIGYLIIMRGQKIKILRGIEYKVTNDDVTVCFIYFFSALIGISYKFATGDYMSYLISESRIGALTQIGNLLTAFQWPAFIGSWILWIKGLRNTKFTTLFITIQLVIIPYQFLQGSKTFLSLLLLSFIFAYYWAKGKIPKTSALLSISIIIIFIFPFVHGFREYVNIEHGKIPSIFNLDIKQIYSLKDDPEQDEHDGLEEKLFSFSARYGGIDHLYGITETIPDKLPYKFGIDYSAFLINLIPRAIWPDKPIFSRGSDYGVSLGTITSVTPFPIAEAYWDLGIPGLFIMMIIWGAVLAGILKLYERIYLRPRLSFFIVTYFLSQIYWISGGESSIPSVISGIPQQVVLMYIIYSLIKRTRKSRKKI